MPSRNSVNKPKDTLNQARKRASLAKKRAARVRKGLIAPPRSSTSSSSGLPKSTAVALYSGAKPTGAVTTKTLSNKRLKKIERNKKYVAKRNEQVLIDAQAQAEDSMEIDDAEPAAAQVQKSKINTVKDALWSVIEDSAASGFIMEANGEGTTLGGPVF